MPASHPLPLYFAYGSNLHVPQMTRRCPGHRVVGRARLVEHALCFRGHSRDWGGAVATVELARGEAVWGVVFTLTADDYTSLDRYENYFGPGAPKNMYDRLSVRLLLEDGREVDALTYVMRPQAGGAPSRRYLGTIVDGGRQHGLPADYVAALARTKTVD